MAGPNRIRVLSDAAAFDPACDRAGLALDCLARPRRQPGAGNAVASRGDCVARHHCAIFAPRQLLRRLSPARRAAFPADRGVPGRGRPHAIPGGARDTCRCPMPWHSITWRCLPSSIRACSFRHSSTPGRWSNRRHGMAGERSVTPRQYDRMTCPSGRMRYATRNICATGRTSSTICSGSTAARRPPRSRRILCLSFTAAFSRFTRSRRRTADATPLPPGGSRIERAVPWGCCVPHYRTTAITDRS